MSEANGKGDLKARAVEALRRANWIETAGDFEIGARTAADTLRRLRSQWAPDRGERVAIAALEAYISAEWPASTDLAHATATIAELRVHCDALRTDLTTAIDERAAVRVLHAEALSIQSQIWDAVGGQREGESLVDAVRRVVEERDAMREERRVAKADDAAAMERLRRLAEPRSLPKPDRVVMRQRWACDDIDGDLYVRSHPVWGVPTVSKSDEVGLSHTMENKPSEMWVSARLMLTSPRWRYLGNGERPIESDTKEASVGELDSVLNKASGGTEHGRIRCDASAQWVSRSRGEQAKANVEVVPCVVQIHTGEIQRLLDEAREAGRAEAKVEIERLRAVVFEFQRATGVLRPEWAKMRLESYESCDTDSLRYECRGCGRPISWEGACSSGACGSAAPPYPYGRGGKHDPLGESFDDVYSAAALRKQLDEANAAIVRIAEEGQREIERLRAVEKSFQKECDRLHRDRDRISDERDGLRDEIVRTYEAISAEPTEGVTLDAEMRKRVADTVAHVKRLEEHRSLLRDTIDAERAVNHVLVAERDDAYRRGQEEIRDRACDVVVDAARGKVLTLVEAERIIATIRSLPIANAPTVSASESPGEAGPGYGGTETAGATESVAREGDDARREPHLGDVVLLADTDDANDFAPAIIRNVRDDDKYDLWAAVPMAPFVYGVPRSRIRLRD